MATNLWLVPLPWGDGTALELPHRETVTSIGRCPTNALIIPRAHQYVSREHCRIRSNLPETDVVVLEDLSPNGTYINGKRVGKGYSKVLKCGDVIELAKPKATRARLQFQLAIYKVRRSNL